MRTCPACHAEVPDRDPPVGFCPACGVELDTSVRPPDLDTEDLPDDGDPLAGWDLDTPSGPSARPDRPGDGVVVAGAGLVGALLGTLLAPRGARGRAGLLGGLVGVAAAAASRRVWELDPPDEAWVHELQR